METILGFTEVEWQAIRLSVRVALACTLVTLPLAVFTGYALARGSFRGKALLESLIHLPLVMPPVTTGYLLLLTLGANSPIGQWLEETLGLRLSFSFYAAVIASAVVSFPLVVRAVRTAMEMVDTGLEDASRLLGASRWRTFCKITAPLAMPGILSGAILAFARSLGEFGATIIFAGNIAGETQTLPLAIYTLMQVPGAEQATLRLVLVSAGISLLAMFVSEWYLKKLKHDRG